MVIYQGALTVTVSMLDLDFGAPHELCTVSHRETSVKKFDESDCVFLGFETMV